jgi:hypothetical protein
MSYLDRASVIKIAEFQARYLVSDCYRISLIAFDPNYYLVHRKYFFLNFFSISLLTYRSVASLAFLVCYQHLGINLRKFIQIQAYDYSLTLSSEVKHIWANQFRTYSTLFLITRYLPFFDIAITFARKFYF